MPNNRIKYQVAEVIIPAGLDFKELKFNLDSNFEKCVGFGIPAPLDVTNPIHTTPFQMSIVDGIDSIQDRTPGEDFLFTPSVPASDRYKKADFPAKGKLLTLKVDTDGVAVGSDFKVKVIFQLQN